MPVETISCRGLTIAVDLQGNEYAVKVCRPDGSADGRITGRAGYAKRRTPHPSQSYGLISPAMVQVKLAIGALGVRVRAANGKTPALMTVNV